MNKKYGLICITFLLGSLSLLAQSKIYTDIKIIDKPITYNAERIKLSLAYLKERHGLIKDKPVIDPKMIVLHFTEINSFQSTFNYFDKVEIENGRAFNKNQSSLNVSSQFVVDRNGTIYRLMDETMFARHIIGLNYCAIGIENIGGTNQPLTPEQVDANIKLVKYLCIKYPIQYLIGHSEYGIFRNSTLWKESNPNYFTSKNDPGNNFMNAVRLGVQEYHLKEKP